VNAQELIFMAREQAGPALADFDELEDDAALGAHNRRAEPERDEEVEPVAYPRGASRSGYLGKGSGVPGWRALAWFWAVILATGVTSATLLQLLGPPRSETAPFPVSTAQLEPSRLSSGGAESAQVPPASVPAASTPSERQPVGSRVSMLLSRAAIQIAQNRLHGPPGDNAMETLAEAYALMPPGSSGDRQRADAMMAQIDQRVRAAAPATDMDQARRAAAVADTPANAATTPRDAARAPNQSGPDEAVRVTPRGAADLPGTSPQASNASTRGGVPATSTTGAQRSYGVSLSVRYAANTPSAEAEAKQVAAQLGSRFDSADTQGETDVPQKAVVRFFVPEDHGTARGVGKTLAEMGYSWRIDNLSRQATSSSPRVIEVWLPLR